MKNDWRLVNQIDYLSNKKLIKNKFVKTNDRDHAHCSFCWVKFGEEENMLHLGYFTDDEKYWICEQCFEDFKEMFGWTLENTERQEDGSTVS